MARAASVPTVLCLGLALSAGGTARATGDYVALDMLFSEYHTHNPELDRLKPTAVSVRYGRHLTPVLTLEGRAGLGADDDRDATVPTTAELSIDSILGVYLRAAMSPTRDIQVYGLAGIARSDLDASTAAPGLRSGAKTDFSVGFGVDAAISAQVSFSFEYLRLADASNYDLSALTIGLRREL